MSRKLTTSILALIMGTAFSLSALAATPVNINKADAATIAKALDGVGMAKAQAIVKYRKAHGPFKNVAELTKVKGIGPATLAHNHGDILLGDSHAAATGSRHSRHGDVKH